MSLPGARQAALRMVLPECLGVGARSGFIHHVLVSWVVTSVFFLGRWVWSICGDFSQWF